jgi:SAM-dependent methyltransferase
MRLYDKKNKRLVYIEQKATPDFWDHQWDVADFKRNVERGKTDRFYLSTLHKYIPDKKGNILEGGCGLGQLVYCMHAHGYKCTGIDFAEKTVRRIKEIFPELNVMVGDVRNLPFPSGHFTGYWSVGVIEHFWVGYHDILSEMRRVLDKDGYVFLLVPYMSFLRILKAKLALYKEFNNGGLEIDNFFQFALNKKIVIKDFETAGFKLVASEPRGGLWGFTQEVSLFRLLFGWLFIYKGQNLLIKGFRFLLDTILSIFAGHTIFLVFRKE